MTITINNKQYSSGKITGSKYDAFCDAMEIITKGQEAENRAWNKNDLALMRETLVEIYDHQFQYEAIYNEVEVADLIVHFMLIEKAIADKVNTKLEKLVKNS